MASQNIYDDALFFELYSEYPRAKEGGKGASEWPELLQMLPDDLDGKTVLDLACGEGWFARWCVSKGAELVDAYDISNNMLCKAERLTKGPKAISASGVDRRDAEDVESGIIKFTRVDLEMVRLPGERYNLVFCGLGLHYIENLGGLMRQVYSSLMLGGIFVFSIEHPFVTAPVAPRFIKTLNTDGDVDQWTVDSYFVEGERSVNWIVDGVVKQHRTVASYFNAMREAGFEVEKLDEWGATNEVGRKHPDWVEGVIPRFLLVKSSKRAADIEAS
ncbi:S-adenosyl-L-methionine-dependent methyltransferase [Diaporthe sp. PMI_573]|nr:S-adenosyl-L-methionine-dependent methyltransferase [Diaporthaceae sp. PMI_573]